MITLEQAQAHLNAWLEADLALATAQEYQFATPSGSRTIKRADISEVRRNIGYWASVVKRLQNPQPSSFGSLVSFNHDSN